MQVWTLNLKDYETSYTTQIFIEASSYNKAFEILTKWYRGWEVIHD